jgi:predicted DNA-binding transcriptional regulator YafY
VRADRLVATLLLLQTRRRITAAEVAAELEVSERTARRDLEALSAAGIPVYAQPGRGGGWELVGGARTDLSGLTAAEARTLFMVAGPEAAATPELKAALRKLVRALPEPFRASAQQAATAVVIDPGGWGRRGHRGGRPKLLDALHGAVADGVQVQLGYADRTGRSSTRVVHPLGLAQKGSVWYLVADTAEGLRTFRVGRVTAVEPTGEAVVRPVGFDLEATWRQIVANVDELRSPHRIDALVDPELVPVLRWMFDKQLQVHGEADAGDEHGIAVSVGCQSPERCAAELAGFGTRLRITDPPEARAFLAELGRQLASTYELSAAGDPGGSGGADNYARR